MYFASGASVIEAAVIYQQADSTSEVQTNGTGSWQSDDIGPIPNYPTNPTDSVFVSFWLKNTSGLSVSDGSVYLLCLTSSSANQGFSYDLTTDDSTLLSDGEYHYFSVEVEAGANAAYCQANTAYANKIGLESGRSGGTGAGLFTFSDASDSFPFIDINTDGTPTPPTDSSITLTSPTAMTYTGNPVPFTGEYTNGGSFDAIQFDLVFNNNQNIVFSGITLPLTNGTDLPFGVSRTLPYSGPYTVRARLTDSTTGSTTAWTATTSFSLNSTSTNPVYLPGAGLVGEECASLDIFCYLQQGFAWAFIPDTESVEQFKTLSSALETKFPFAYVYDIDEFREELFDSADTGTTTITVTIMGSELTILSKELIDSVPFTPTIKLILGWLIIIGTIEYLYHKVRTIHDPHSL